MTDKKNPASPVGFEKSLRQLEGIVKRLEEDEVPLDQALKLFAEGQALARACEGQLRSAENEIRRLLETPDGTIGEVPFETDAPADPGTDAPIRSGTPEIDSTPQPPPGLNPAKDDDLPF